MSYACEAGVRQHSERSSVRPWEDALRPIICKGE